MITAKYMRKIIAVAALEYDTQLDELLTEFMPLFVANNGTGVVITRQDCATHQISFDAAKKLLLERGFYISTLGVDTDDEIAVSIPPGKEFFAWRQSPGDE